MNMIGQARGPNSLEISSSGSAGRGIERPKLAGFVRFVPTRIYT
jgi:hypothetical protein